LTLRGLRGVKLVKVDSMDNQVSDSLEANKRRAIVVGVYDDMSYATPASAIVGHTLNLTVVYDTGLRPDPRVHEGELVPGERQAVQIEILQTIGRLGRLGCGGTAYFTSDARVMIQAGVPLYDIMATAFRCSLGLSNKGSLSVDKARRYWQVSGIPKKRPVITQVPEPGKVTELPHRESTPVQEIVHKPPPSYKTDVSEEELVQIQDVKPTLTRVDSAASSRPGSSSSSASSTLYNIPEGGYKVHGRKKWSESGNVDIKSMPSLKPTVVKPDDDATEREIITIRRTQPVVSTGLFKRRESMDGPAATQFLVTVVDGTGKPLSKVSPSPDWRPFRKADDLGEGEVDVQDGLGYFVAKLYQAHTRGDYVYPAVFPQLFEAGVSWVEQDSARRVLAEDMPASYSEKELMAVMREWNVMARSTCGRHASAKVIDLYVKYFLNFISWNKNTDVSVY